jgi:hypothetical protein
VQSPTSGSDGQSAQPDPRCLLFLIDEDVPFAIDAGTCSTRRTIVTQAVHGVEPFG